MPNEFQYNVVSDALAKLDQTITKLGKDLNDFNNHIDSILIDLSQIAGYLSFLKKEFDPSDKKK